jgi:CDGSH-type Zn-finger protein
MARLIRLDRTGPYKIEPKDFPTDGKSIWICGCGLSGTMPYCDKTHKVCAAEQPGKVYRYDPLTKTVVEERAEGEGAAGGGAGNAGPAV